MSTAVAHCNGRKFSLSAGKNNRTTDQQQLGVASSVPQKRRRFTSCGQIRLPHATFLHAQSLQQHRRHARLAQGLQSLRRIVCRKHSLIHDHVSPCASQYTEHQHKFSLTYLSCVTVLFFSEPRLVVHALRRSTEGWYFYGIPLLNRL